MIFKLYELYNQGQDFKKDPVGAGVGLGREAIAPMFVVPIILLAVCSLGMLALWWWIGWGVFLFLSIMCWFLLIGFHSAYKGVAKMFTRSEMTIKDEVARYRQGNQTVEQESIIIDVEARE